MKEVIFGIALLLIPLANAIDIQATINVQSSEKTIEIRKITPEKPVFGNTLTIYLNHSSGTIHARVEDKNGTIISQTQATLTSKKPFFTLALPKNCSLQSGNYK